MVDILVMDNKRRLTRRESMIQWVGVIISVAALTYTGIKDYQKGDIKLPILPQKHLTKVVYPVQYCLMAYDPNVKKIFYLHDNGQWYDFAPQIREYQNQGQEALATPNGTQGTQGYNYGQSAQTTSYPIRR
jgi:hypothetical protein